MGTHPIFESDFDCLTDLMDIVSALDGRNLQRQLKRIFSCLDDKSLLSASAVSTGWRDIIRNCNCWTDLHTALIESDFYTRSITQRGQKNRKRPRHSDFAIDGMDKYWKLGRTLNEMYTKAGPYQTRMLVHTPKSFNNRITSFTVSPEFIATANLNGDVQIWSRLDLKTNYGTLENVSHHQKTELVGAGRLLVTTNTERTKITLWNISVPSLSDPTSVFAWWEIQSCDIAANISRIITRICPPTAKKCGKMLLARSNDVQITDLGEMTNRAAAAPLGQGKLCPPPSVRVPARISAPDDVIIPKPKLVALSGYFAAILWEAE